ncbi:MAG: STT3 domain-containing protein [Candidatus Micrarchaeota archaeon]
MLVFDKTFALLVAIIFGIAGLPWAWWVFRKDESVNWFEKIVFGYAFGIILVPFLFLLENFIGIMFSPLLIYVNWLIVFLLGLFLAIKDRAIEIPKSKFEFKLPGQEGVICILVTLIMVSIFSIGFSNSGIPIMDLDPYFYLDGVRQVVYEGHNYFDDSTAWYPEVESSHMGQPLWKYMLASWFSIYNGEEEYSPYRLIESGSVYPPIIGALAAFFAYFLFKTLYNRRVGLLAAGLAAFMPIMLVKFQGGRFSNRTI